MFGRQASVSAQLKPPGLSSNIALRLSVLRCSTSSYEAPQCNETQPLMQLRCWGVATQHDGTVSAAGAPQPRGPILGSQLLRPRQGRSRAFTKPMKPPCCSSLHESCTSSKACLDRSSAGHD